MGMSGIYTGEFKSRVFTGAFQFVICDWSFYVRLEAEVRSLVIWSIFLIPTVNTDSLIPTVKNCRKTIFKVNGYISPTASFEGYLMSNETYTMESRTHCAIIIDHYLSLFIAECELNSTLQFHKVAPKYTRYRLYSNIFVFYAVKTGQAVLYRTLKKYADLEFSFYTHQLSRFFLVQSIQIIRMKCN